MAEFTPDIQGPQSAWQIGRGAEAPKSLLGGLSDVLTKGATEGIDIFRTDKQRSLQASEGEELSGAVREYAAGQNPATPAPPSTPSLIGQQTHPAESDPGYQDAKAEMDRHAAAAAQGSPGAKQALLTRLSEIQSRYATQNPYYAPQLAEYAQKTLGFNANSELFQTASQAEDFQKKLSESAQTITMNKAAEAGALHYNPDGSVDTKQSLLNGQQLLASEHQTAASLAQAQLAQAQAKPALSKDQNDDLEFRTAQPAAKAIIDASTGGLFSGLKGVLDKWDASKPMDQAMIATQIGRTQAQAEFAVDQFADKNNIGWTTRQNLKAYVKSEFAPFQTIMGTDLTSSKQIASALQKVKDRYGLKLNDVAPGVAAAIAIGGAPAAGALIQGFTGPASTNGPQGPGYDSMTSGLSNYFNSVASPAEVLKGVNGVMAGKYSIAAEPDPAKARAVAQNALPVLDHFTDDPTNIKDPKASKAFGNLVQGTAEAAVGSNDPATILNVAPHLLRPGAVQGLIAYAKNPANANDAEKTMAFYGQYVQRAQIESAKVIQQGVDQKITPIIVGPHSHRIGQEINVHVSAAAGPDGSVAPTFDAKDNQGRPVQLTDAQKRQALTLNPAFGRTVQTYNQAQKADQLVIQSFKAQNSPAQKPETADDVVNKFSENGPSPGALKLMQAHEARLMEVIPGAKVTSDYRTDAQNRAAHGAEHSMHKSAQAIDFSAPGMTKAEVLATLKAQGLPVTELLDASDEARLGVGHMKPGTFHWGWGDKRSA